MSILERASLTTAIYGARSAVGAARHLATESRALSIGVKLEQAQIALNEAIQLAQAAETAAQKQSDAAITGQ